MGRIVTGWSRYTDRELEDQLLLSECRAENYPGILGLEASEKAAKIREVLKMRALVKLRQQKRLDVFNATHPGS